MVETNKTPSTANTAVPNEGDRDRVAMLSLRADGTPDQHNPEILGNSDAVLAATREQFKQQAVSAADVQRTDAGQAAGPVAVVEDAPQDPSIQKVQDQHAKVAQAAEKAAERTVKQLSRD